MTLLEMVYHFAQLRCVYLERHCLLLLLCLLMCVIAICLLYLVRCEWAWGDPHCL